MSENAVPKYWPSFASFSDDRTVDATSLIADKENVSVQPDSQDILHPGDKVAITVSAWDPHDRRLRIDAEVQRHEKLGTAEIDSEGVATFVWDVLDEHIQGDITLTFKVTALDADHHRRHNGTDQNLFAHYKVRPKD